MYLYQHYGRELAHDLHRERLEAAERHRLAKPWARRPFAGFRKGFGKRLPRYEKRPSQALTVKPVRL